MTERQRIVLSEDDFDGQPAGPVATPAPGPSVPNGPPLGGLETAAPTMSLPAVTRGVPRRVDAPADAGVGRVASTATAGSWLNSAGKAPLIAAAVGVVAAWIVTEVFGIAEIEVHSQTGSNAVSGLWTAVVAVLLGGTLLSFDRAVAGAWNAAGKRFANAILPLLGVGFVAGYLGNVIYLHIIQSAVEEALRGGTALTGNDVRIYLARGLGWALFGVGIGATIGALNRSKRQALNGALGGGLGGAAGGLVFQFLEANLGASVGTSRLLGLVAIGLLLAVAIRAVEAARREAWLQVLSGGMAGKEFILYHAITRLGSTPECEIFLVKDPAIAKVHAQIEDRGHERVLNAAPGAPVYVNQTPVTAHLLRSGDQLQLGNTVLNYSERSVAASVA